MFRKMFIKKKSAMRGVEVWLLLQAPSSVCSDVLQA